MNYIIRILLAILLVGVLTFFSYYKSKTTAVALVGDTLQYFPLTQTTITIEPFERNQIVWLFKFSLPDSFDEEFFIYTTLLGNVTLTNPLDVEKRLRCSEKLEHHPYSEEGIEQDRQRAREGKPAQEICK